eukprot:TRINITY_DN742_c1_g1_i3.p1 TRINITY_DN742_c1_g1~~TRINITY_DN742_c1_g1_i3.p1  ORF type:complete len:1330 (-),score=217.58 TRINITY_DN742_c1_g1_i3:71-4060(-)
MEAGVVGVGANVNAGLAIDLADRELAQKLESQLTGLKRVGDVFSELVDGMKKLDEVLTRESEDRASFTASLLKHSCDAGVSSEDRLAQCLQKLGQVYKFVCQKADKLFADLRQFRAAMEKVTQTLVDLKLQYERDHKPLEAKLAAAHQKVQKIRQSRGGVNMQRLVEAEEERDVAKLQMSRSGTALLAKVADSQVRAQNCLASGLYLTVMTYAKYFQAGSQQMDYWASDSLFIALSKTEAETLPSEPPPSPRQTVSAEPQPTLLVPPNANSNNGLDLSEDASLSSRVESPLMGRNRAAVIGQGASDVRSLRMTGSPTISRGLGADRRGSVATPPRRTSIPSTVVPPTANTGQLASIGSQGSWMSAKQPVLPKLRLRFEGDKQGFKRRKAVVLTVDFDSGILRKYFPRTQKAVEQPISDLLQVARCGIDKQLRLRWKGSTNVEKYVFRKKDEKERFYEAVANLRRAPSAKEERSEKISVFLGTWNLGNADPPKEMGTWITRAHDIVVIGAQECEYNGRIGDSNSTESDWFARICLVLGEGYVTIASKSLVDMRMIVLARREHYYKISRVRIGSEATGIGNVYGNKGGIGVSMCFNETKLCFIASHLAAHDRRVDARNSDFAAIVNNMHLGASPFDATNFFHATFWLGDLNYRISLPREEVLSEIGKGNWRKLCHNDQLINEQKNGRCFAGFHESKINFAPTYRYNRGDRTYSNEKMRTPSYCDRILYKHVPNFVVDCIKYGASDEITTSDHSPVYGVFTLETTFPNPIQDELKASISLNPQPHFLTDRDPGRQVEPTDEEPTPPLLTEPVVGRPECIIKMTGVKLTLIAAPGDETAPPASTSTASGSIITANSGGSAIFGNTSSGGTVGRTGGATTAAINVAGIDGAGEAAAALAGTWVAGTDWNSGRSYRGTVRSNLQAKNKGQSLYLAFSADFIDGFNPSPAQYDVTSTAIWEEHQVHSFTTNREWLLRQYLWVLVRDASSNKIVGQGCIPLGPAGDEAAMTFYVKLTSSGVLVGNLAGSVLVSRPSLDRRPESASGLSALEVKGDIVIEKKYAVVKQGYLTKEGNKRRSWKRRWFVATSNGNVSYFTTENGKEKGNINMAACTLSEAPGHSGKKNCFAIAGPKRTFYICADDEVDLQVWLKALQKCIDISNSTQQSSGGSGVTLTGGGGGGGGGSGSAGVPASLASWSVSVPVGFTHVAGLRSDLMNAPTSGSHSPRTMSAFPPVSPISHSPPLQPQPLSTANSNNNTTTIHTTTTHTTPTSTALPILPPKPSASAFAATAFSTGSPHQLHRTVSHGALSSHSPTTNHLRTASSSPANNNNNLTHHH